MIEIKNLKFCLEKFKLEIDFLKIEKNQKVAVLGENGSGKTTFLNLLSGFYKTEKSIKILDKFIEDINFHERAKLISYLPQFPDILFNFSVFETVLFGRYPHLKGFSYSKEDFEKTERILEKFSLEKFKHKSFAKLSGGEKKRVMLARALNQESEILLFDEPFANLDIKHSVEFLKILKDIKKTVICSIHDINLAVNGFKRFIFFKKGKIIYDIEKEELNEKILFEVFEVNFIRSGNFFNFSI